MLLAGNTLLGYKSLDYKEPLNPEGTESQDLGGCSAIEDGRGDLEGAKKYFSGDSRREISGGAKISSCINRHFSTLLFSLLFNAIFNTTLYDTSYIHIGSHMSTTPLQAFRAQSSSNLISIPTRHDLKSNQHVVLWRDIQRLFQSAENIMHGGDAVLFVTNEELEE